MHAILWQVKQKKCLLIFLDHTSHVVSRNQIKTNASWRRQVRVRRDLAQAQRHPLEPGRLQLRQGHHPGTQLDFVYISDFILCLFTSCLQARLIVLEVARVLSQHKWRFATNINFSGTTDSFFFQVSLTTPVSALIWPKFALCKKQQQPYLLWIRQRLVLRNE